MRHIQLFLPSPSLHSAKAYLSLNIHEQEEVHLPILRIYSLSRWFLYNPTLMGVISFSKIFAITPEQSGLSHYGLQKSTQLQEKLYQESRQIYSARMSQFRETVGFPFHPCSYKSIPDVHRKYLCRIHLDRQRPQQLWCGSNLSSSISLIVF